MTEARRIRGKGGGTGDDVVIIPETSGLTRMRASHAGSSNLAIWAYGETSDLLVNEIGRYRGRVRVPPGTVVLVIQADGRWILQLE